MADFSPEHDFGMVSTLVGDDVSSDSDGSTESVTGPGVGVVGSGPGADPAVREKTAQHPKNKIKNREEALVGIYICMYTHYT